jgi:phosphatidate cytidylyltransferase
LIARVIVGLLGAPVVLALLVAGKIPSAILCAIIAGVSALEYSRISSISGNTPLTAVTVALSLGFVADAAVGGGQTVPLVAASVLLPLALQVLSGSPQDAMRRTAQAAFGPLYTGFTVSRLVLIRAAGAGGAAAASLAQPAPDPGMGLALLVVVLVWMCDMGAFFIGCRLGRRRLAPALSPKKSVEGCIGGYVWAVAGALAFKALGDATGLWYTVSWPLSVASAVVVATSGQVGDLAESALKRDVGVKDSGSLFPGHGGMLDRFDSLVFAAPAAYYFFVRALPNLFGG